MTRPKFDLKEYDACPYCKTGQIILKVGKFGSFFGCSRFPSCAFTQPIEEDEDADREIIDTTSRQPREELEDNYLVFSR